MPALDWGFDDSERTSPTDDEEHSRRRWSTKRCKEILSQADVDRRSLFEVEASRQFQPVLREVREELTEDASGASSCHPRQGPEMPTQTLSLFSYLSRTNDFGLSGRLDRTEAAVLSVCRGQGWVRPSLEG
jgi:hypothetical protein